VRVALPLFYRRPIAPKVGEAMRVVSVINFKGGVGKTTLTANLGAELARRGQRVLVVDLDPQSSLTYSFYAPDVAAGRIPPDRSIKAWYDSFERGVPQRQLSECVVIPSSVNQKVSEYGGFLGLVPSTMSLIDHELSMLANVGLRGVAPGQELFRLRRALSSALRDAALGSYDIALIDCAPNFNIVTQSAIVASDDILVPSRPDYLSTLGITSLFHNVGRLVETYNQQTAEFSPGTSIINPIPLGIVFTMVQYRSVNPINAHTHYMDLTSRRNPHIPIFATSIRENVAFGAENPDGIPVILRLRPQDKIYVELMALAAEFLGAAGLKERAAA
jgi:chromosome partitioning protein